MANYAWLPATVFERSAFVMTKGSPFVAAATGTRECRRSVISYICQGSRRLVGRGRGDFLVLKCRGPHRRRVCIRRRLRVFARRRPSVPLLKRELAGHFDRRSQTMEL